MSRRHPVRIEERDRLARDAARVLATDPGLDLEAAIARARRTSGLREASAPSRALVYRHVEALQQATFGQRGFERRQAVELRAVVDLLDLVALLLQPEGLQVVGQLASRPILGGVDVHVRLHGGAPMESCAMDLEAAGLRELRFQTVKTLIGYLPRLTLENEGRLYFLTQCPLECALEPARNLFTDQPIASCWLEQLRARSVVPPVDDEPISPDHP